MDLKELKLPADLCRRVEERVLAGSEQSLEDLVTSFLEELCGEFSDLDRAEEQRLEQRLKELGYL